MNIMALKAGYIQFYPDVKAIFNFTRQPNYLCKSAAYFFWSGCTDTHENEENWYHPHSTEQSSLFV